MQVRRASILSKRDAFTPNSPNSDAKIPTPSLAYRMRVWLLAMCSFVKLASLRDGMLAQTWKRIISPWEHDISTETDGVLRWKHGMET